jgi:hypothetical protein
VLEDLCSWLRGALHVGNAAATYPWGGVRVLGGSYGADCFTLAKCVCNGDTATPYTLKMLLRTLAQTPQGTAYIPSPAATAPHARTLYLKGIPKLQADPNPDAWAETMTTSLNYPDNREKREFFTLSADHINYALQRYQDGVRGATYSLPHVAQWALQCATELRDARLQRRAPALQPCPPAPPPPPTPATHSQGGAASIATLQHPGSAAGGGGLAACGVPAPPHRRGGPAALSSMPAVTMTVRTRRRMSSARRKGSTGKEAQQVGEVGGWAQALAV